MISVIVATHNRSELLGGLLNRLTDQTLSQKDYEIIIVDDGSVDDTEENTKKFLNQNGNIKYVKQNNRGPATARNRGIKESRGEILAFTDDDCLPAKNWIETIKKEFDRNNGIAGLEGLTFTEKTKVTPLTHQLTNTEGGEAYPTCNAAYRAYYVRTEGGFDENYPYPHNEDVDLAWRIMKHGPIEFCDNMRVYHPPRKEKLGALIRRGRYLASEFHLFYKFPDKYAKKRAKNPWINIYIRYIFCIKLLSVCSWLKAWRKPWLFIMSFMISSLQVLYLILMVPKFIKYESQSKQYALGLYEKERGLRTE